MEIRRGGAGEAAEEMGLFNRPTSFHSPVIRASSRIGGDALHFMGDWDSGG